VVILDMVGLDVVDVLVMDALFVVMVILDQVTPIPLEEVDLDPLYLNSLRLPHQPPTMRVHQQKHLLMQPPAEKLHRLA